MYKLVRKGRNNSPYDLSALRWICENCGGEKRPNGPYQSGRPGVRYCKCHDKSKKEG